MSDRAGVSSARHALLTVPRARMALAALVVFSVVVLGPEGLGGPRLALFLGGATLGAVATWRSGRWERWLWSAAGFLMGGTLILVVFRSPFTDRRWGGLTALMALIVLQIASDSRRPVSAGR